jgi:competence protein ComGB
MFKKSWSIQEQAFLFKKLSQLLEKGYSLGVAIELIQFQLKLSRKKQLDHCLAKLRQGTSLQEILTEFHFSSEVLSYLYYAETHGDLAFALQHSSRILEQKQHFKQKMNGILRYPILLIFLVILLLMFVRNVLLPEFYFLYESMDIEISKTMQLFLFIPQYFPQLLLLFLSIVLFLILSYWVFLKKIPITKRVRALLFIPFVGTLIKMKNTQYVCSQLSSLLRGGLSILAACHVFEKQSHFPFFQEEGKRIKKLLSEGEGLEQVFQSPLYELQFHLVIRHGQANGNLDKELGDYGEFIIESVEDALKRFLFFLQPLTFIAIGAFVIMLYVSIMLPLYQMMETL